MSYQPQQPFNDRGRGSAPESLPLQVSSHLETPLSHLPTGMLQSPTPSLQTIVCLRTHSYLDLESNDCITDITTVALLRPHQVSEWKTEQPPTNDGETLVMFPESSLLLFMSRRRVGSSSIQIEPGENNENIYTWETLQDDTYGGLRYKLAMSDTPNEFPEQEVPLYARESSEAIGKNKTKVQQLIGSVIEVDSVHERPRIAREHINRDFVRFYLPTKTADALTREPSFRSHQLRLSKPLMEYFPKSKSRQQLASAHAACALYGMTPTGNPLLPHPIVHHPSGSHFRTNDPQGPNRASPFLIPNPSTSIQGPLSTSQFRIPSIPRSIYDAGTRFLPGPVLYGPLRCIQPDPYSGQQSYQSLTAPAGWSMNDTPVLYMGLPHNQSESAQHASSSHQKRQLQAPKSLISNMRPLDPSRPAFDPRPSLQANPLSDLAQLSITSPPQSPSTHLLRNERQGGSHTTPHALSDNLQQPRRQWSAFHFTGSETIPGLGTTTPAYLDGLGPPTSHQAIARSTNLPSDRALRTEPGEHSSGPARNSKFKSIFDEMSSPKDEKEPSGTHTME